MGLFLSYSIPSIIYLPSGSIIVITGVVLAFGVVVPLEVSEKYRSELSTVFFFYNFFNRIIIWINRSVVKEILSKKIHTFFNIIIIV